MLVFMIKHSFNQQPLRPTVANWFALAISPQQPENAGKFSCFLHDIDVMWKLLSIFIILSWFVYVKDYFYPWKQKLKKQKSPFCLSNVYSFWKLRSVNKRNKKEKNCNFISQIIPSSLKNINAYINIHISYIMCKLYTYFIYFYTLFFNYTYIF